MKSFAPPLSSLGIALLLIQPLAALQASARSESSRTPSSQPRHERASLSGEVTLRTAGRGGPWIRLTDGHALMTRYAGGGTEILALEQNRAHGLSLANGDFDEDSAADLVCGYATPDGRGILALHRGDVDSIQPNSPGEHLRSKRGGFGPAPFLAPAYVFGLPVAPEFLGAGDFNADGRCDVLTASSTRNALYFLKGDGRLALGEPELIELPGRVTAMAVGDINRADGLEDVVVGVMGPEGPQTLVFEAPNGALRREPEIMVLPAEATSLAVGQLDASYEYDLAISAGSELLIVHGRDRKFSADENRPEFAPAAISRYGVPFNIAAMVLGDFCVERDRRTEVAVVSEGGTLLYFERSADPDGWAATSEVRIPELRGPGAMPNGRILARVKVSSLGTDDLMVFDRASDQMHIVSGGPGTERPGHDVASLKAEGGAMAALPMRSNRTALTDLVSLTSSRTDLSLASISPAATFTVTNTNDSGGGSLRQAILDSNQNPGPDTIDFNAGGVGAQTITVNSPLPAITDPVTLDGTTQPGFAGAPIIELDGANAGSGANGLVINAGSSVVKGLAIGNFNGHAISLQQRGDNMIMGNHLGTDASGTQNRGNTGEGVNIQNSDVNMIIGNTIVFNGDGGSVINSSENVIQDNNLGTDAGMTLNKGNLGAGFGFANASNNRFERNRIAFNRLGFVGFGGFGNLIGGTDPADGNNIGLNETGVSLNNANSNALKANFIGTNPVGDSLGNQGAGIELTGTSSNNNIGGATLDQGNTIAFNRTGISAVAGANSNLYLLNSIHSNTMLGIDNGGGNRNIEPPQLTSATASASDTLITGRFFGFPNRRFALHFYLGANAPVEEGKAPLGGFTVTTDFRGLVDFSGRFSSPLAALNLTALATSVDTNDTSEFSNGVGITSTARPDLELAKSGPDTAKCREGITYTITVTNRGTAAAVGATVIDLLSSCVGNTVTLTTPEGLIPYPMAGNKVATRVPRLDPNASVTITVMATLTENCVEVFSNFAAVSVDAEADFSNNSGAVVTKVECVKIDGMSIRGKHVVVSGVGFEKGDQIEINGAFAKKTKFIDIDELLAKKGRNLLMPCDPANPMRTNVIRLIRPSVAQPIQDTQAFATCP